MKNISALLFIAAAVMFSCTGDQGTIEVDYVEATAIYGSMSDLRSIPLNEGIRDIENPGKIFIGEDFILIGEEGVGIHVIDNNDRTAPYQVAFINIPGNREYFVQGEFLYAESYYDVIKVDISDARNAVVAGRAEYAVQKPFTNSSGQELIGFSYENKSVVLNVEDDFYNEVIDDQLVYLDFAQNVIPQSAVPSSFAGNSSSKSGTVNRVTRTEGHVYLISNNNLIIIEDSGLFGSDVVAHENFKSGMETVFPYEGKLYLGSRTSMNIFDLTQPTMPREVYEFDHVTSCDPVLPHESVAYVTLRTADFSDCPGNINALVVLDLEDLDKAKELEEIQMSSPYGMNVISDKLYVGEGVNGLKVFDVSNSEKPVLLKHYDDIEAYDIINDPVKEEIIFIAGPNGLQQFSLDSDEVFSLNSVISF